MQCIFGMHFLFLFFRPEWHQVLYLAHLQHRSLIAFLWHHVHCAAVCPLWHASELILLFLLMFEVSFHQPVFISSHVVRLKRWMQRFDHTWFRTGGCKYLKAMSCSRPLCRHCGLRRKVITTGPKATSSGLWTLLPHPVSSGFAFKRSLLL